MSSLVYKNELFSVREFIVLAAYAGMDEIRMLSGTCQVPMKPEELNEVVFQLYQRGVLCWNGNDGYDLDPEIRSLLREIKYAEKDVEIHFEGGKGLLYCFINTEVTVMELSRNDVERIRLHRISKDAFLEELSDRGIIPPYDRGKAFKEQMEECEKLSEEFQQKNPELFTTGGDWNQKQSETLKKVLEKENMLSAYSLVYDHISGRQIMRILLLQKDFCQCIVTADAEQVWMMRLEAAVWKEMWKQLECSQKKGGR